MSLTPLLPRRTVQSPELKQRPSQVPPESEHPELQKKSLRKCIVLLVSRPPSHAFQRLQQFHTQEVILPLANSHDGWSPKSKTCSEGNSF